MGRERIVNNVVDLKLLVTLTVVQRNAKIPISTHATLKDSNMKYIQNLINYIQIIMILRSILVNFARKPIHYNTP